MQKNPRSLGEIFRRKNSRLNGFDFMVLKFENV